ncbi:MAG: sterol desaturase family protein, partial [Myxococcota bacterium]
MSPMQPSPLFLLTVVLLGAVEYLWRRSDGKPWDRAGVLSTLVIMAGQVLSKAMTAALIGVVLFAAYDVAPVHWELNHWTTWAAGFVAIEFAYYWMHRASHRVRWFWATHNVHHSPTVFILPVALRLGWTGGVTGSWIFYVPLALLGFHPVLIGTLLLINLRYQFFLHTEQVRSLGPLEWFMNTPSHHRVHHASNNRYLDKNFGGVLIVFDRLFGTFAAETADESIRYGLTEPAPNDRPLRVVFHEWTRIYRDLGHCKTASDVVAVLFGPPRSDANPPSFELKMPRRALTSLVLVLVLGGGVGVAWSSAKAQSNPW